VIAFVKMLASLQYALTFLMMDVIQKTGERIAQDSAPVEVQYPYLKSATVSSAEAKQASRATVYAKPAI